MLSLLFATSAHHVRKTSLSSRCRGLHTTSVFQLQRHDVNDDGPTLPDLPGGPRRQRERPSGSIFDYFLRLVLYLVKIHAYLGSGASKVNYFDGRY